MTQTIVKPPSNVNVPEHALFISQSGTQNALMQTIIDLENNEMVVLTYNYTTIENVTRTGVFLNPEDYKNREQVGTDAPFRENDDEDDDKTAQEDIHDKEK